VRLVDDMPHIMNDRPPARRTMTAEDVRAALQFRLDLDGLTHDQLAQRLGVTQGYLSKVIAGDCNPGTKLLAALGLQKVVAYVLAQEPQP
jgi:predicted transcriptional regulator